MEAERAGLVQSLRDQDAAEAAVQPGDLDVVPRLVAPVEVTGHPVDGQASRPVQREIRQQQLPGEMRKRMSHHIERRSGAVR